MNTDQRRSEMVYDSFPRELRPPKIQQESDPRIGSPEIIEALRGVLRREVLDALQLNDHLVLQQQIREVLADNFAFIPDRKRSLRLRIEPAKPNFLEQAALVNFFRRTKRIQTSNAAPKMFSVIWSASIGRLLAAITLVAARRRRSHALNLSRQSAEQK